MAKVMLALGEFQFGVSTAEYQRLQTSMSWRWASKARFGRRPAKQYHGPGGTTKTLEITIYPQNKHDLARFQQIKAQADRGEPLRMVAGGARWVEGALVSSGADLGLWVIEQLSIDETMFMEDGTALEQKGSLAIADYGDDEV